MHLFDRLAQKIIRKYLIRANGVFEIKVFHRQSDGLLHLLLSYRARSLASFCGREFLQNSDFFKRSFFIELRLMFFQIETDSSG